MHESPSPEVSSPGFQKAPGEPTRVLTGVKPTGIPHIGNYLGAIRPAIELAKTHETFLFIADLHALTTERDAKKLENDTYSVAATYLALGVDPKRTVFYKQTDVPEVTTLAWILSCITPLGFLNRSHAFKDALENRGLSADEINHGVFAYPVLMAADILLYDADVVPVGKDQKQHLEITEELARKFNHVYGPVLRVPKAAIDERVMTIVGLDGKKMSKSYNNTIELWSTDAELKQRVYSVKTDSTPYGQPLSTDGDTLFALYSLFASPEKQERLRRQYESARKDPTCADADLADAKKNFFGWGDAKKALYDEILESLGEARKEYARIMNDRAYIRDLLRIGAERAQHIATKTMTRVFEATGLVR